MAQSQSHQGADPHASERGIKLTGVLMRFVICQIFAELDPEGTGFISSRTFQNLGETRCSLYATTESSTAWKKMVRDLELERGGTVSEVGHSNANYSADCHENKLRLTLLFVFCGY